MIKMALQKREVSQHRLPKLLYFLKLEGWRHTHNATLLGPALAIRELLCHGNSMLQ